MIPLKSSIFQNSGKMTGARSLWRANGMKNENFGKPIFAIANSFTQFVPGHTHLHQIGQYVKSIFTKKGYFAAEFNTIAIDDGIAMGHEGMLYSLPSRDLIADSIEYMCNAHRVDALFCISNCDKITPGMLMAAMRLNIPVVFVSGGPMEAGIVNNRKVDLVNAIISGGDDSLSESQIKEYELNSCPSCGSCSGMFTANSMNCLTEALGLALPGNGSVLATHSSRKRLFESAAELLISNTLRYYNECDDSVLPRSIASKKAFENAMAVDVAMGGSTNTVLHILAIAHEANLDFTLKDIDTISQKVRCLCKISPNSDYHIEDFNRAGGVFGIFNELNKKGLINSECNRVDNLSVEQMIKKTDITSLSLDDKYKSLYLSSPASSLYPTPFEGVNQYESPDSDRKNGCIRDWENAYSDVGGLSILYGNIAKNGCVIKTAGIDRSLHFFKGKARVYYSQEEAMEAILNNEINEGDVVVITFEGPKGGPGMQEMLYPTSFLKSKGLEKKCALITDGRFSGGTAGLSIGHISPEAASGGEIALIRDGDFIEIDISQKQINLCISDEELNNRYECEKQKGHLAFKPVSRKRLIPQSLKYYSRFVSSADKGAVREINND